MIDAVAPGKLVLTGEYAVLHGAPALVAAVGRLARVRLSRDLGEAGRVSVAAPQLGLTASLDMAPPLPGPLSHDGRLGVLSAVLREAANSVQLPRLSLQLHIDTADFFHGPTKLGFGSSAAVAVASLAALLELGAAGRRPRAEIFTRALRAHRQAQHGRGSGVDVAASTFGGVLRFCRHGLPEPVGLPQGVGFAPVWSGQSASTPHLVAQVQRSAEGSGAVRRALRSLGGLARAAVDACEDDDAEAFLTAVSRYHGGLERLGGAAGVDIVTAMHQRLAQLVVGAGGHYKSSGAGGGDVGLAFWRSPEVKECIQHALRRAGFELLDVAVPELGVHVQQGV